MTQSNTLTFQVREQHLQRQTGMEHVTCKELKKDQCEMEPREQQGVEAGEASWSLWTVLRAFVLKAYTVASLKW